MHTKSTECFRSNCTFACHTFLHIQVTGEVVAPAETAKAEKKPEEKPKEDKKLKDKKKDKKPSEEDVTSAEETPKAEEAPVKKEKEPKAEKKPKKVVSQAEAFNITKQAAHVLRIKWISVVKYESMCNSTDVSILLCLIYQKTAVLMN